MPIQPAQEIMNGEPTNHDRADRAARILDAYAAEKGEPTRETIADAAELIADIRHLCHREGENYLTILRLAHIHYHTEQQ